MPGCPPILTRLVASKFFEHFVFISDAMTFRSGGNDTSLWNEEDGYEKAAALTSIITDNTASTTTPSPTADHGRSNSL